MTAPKIATLLKEGLIDRGDALAIFDSGHTWALSGRELTGAALNISEHLIPKADETFIFYVDKSPLYYGLLTASFLTGINFCPLDIQNPTQRVYAIARQLPNPRIICDQEAKVSAFLALGLRAECLKLEALSRSPYSDLPTSVTTNDAYYYIATSGSTGEPKIVKIQQDRTVPFVNWAVRFYDVNAATRWAQFSSIGFDLSLVDFLTTICGSGVLVSFAALMDRFRPAPALKRCKITHWHSVPSMIPYILAESDENDCGPACSLFTFCGEPFNRVDAHNLATRFPKARIVNTYGPTETTLFCSFFEYKRDDNSISGSTLPIGAPIPTWNFIYVKDGGDERLFIVSHNMAEGYVNRTSQEFQTVKVFEQSLRVYDTGDYFTTDGRNTYFSHRKDSMVKLSGNRVDLGEIEAAGIRSKLINPIALIVEGVLFLVAEGHNDEEARVKILLAEYLPQYAVPKRIFFQTFHPRTLNGKIDRGRLREIIIEFNG